ncbi:DUF2460 domain-containing protein [Brevundimonas sp.]|jgi:uncharacterized protein (TIGR02217 family)|uniref:DUF2460 domain-containing protein n=1 Tax=Brevundimonas sp. TaxID=1871086 RepID=UPI002E0E9EA4|nr:DUF2460 domain-containing protein [Brevundimonas sp.]
MSFHEISLPARLAFGSTGGVERRTEVVTLASGFERRSTPWAEGRRRWLIGANLRSLADMAELVAFFEARAGRLHGFRFRDFMDFRSCAPGAEPAATDQAIGTGDGETVRFQLTKGARMIHKPAPGSVVVAVDGVLVAAEVDATTGVVTLAAAPEEGAAVTAGFLFDVPVRFDADRIDVTLESFDAGRMAAVPLVEVRV